MLTRNPESALAGAAGSHKRAVWSDPIDLQLIKDIAEELGRHGQRRAGLRARRRHRALPGRARRPPGRHPDDGPGQPAPDAPATAARARQPLRARRPAAALRAHHRGRPAGRDEAADGPHQALPGAGHHLRDDPGDRPAGPAPEPRPGDVLRGQGQRGHHQRPRTARAPLPGRDADHQPAGLGPRIRGPDARHLHLHLRRHGARSASRPTPRSSPTRSTSSTPSTRRSTTSPASWRPPAADPLPRGLPRSCVEVQPQSLDFGRTSAHAAWKFSPGGPPRAAGRRPRRRPRGRPRPVGRGTRARPASCGASRS